MSDRLLDDQIRAAFQELGDRRPPPPAEPRSILAKVARRRRRKRAAVVAVVVVTSAAVAVPALLVTTQDDRPAGQVAAGGGDRSPSPSTATKTSGTPPLTSTEYPEYGPIPGNVVRELRRHQVNLTPADPTDVPVSLKEAVDAARSGSLRDIPVDRITATLATITANDRTLNNRLVWVVTFSGVPEHPMGPVPPGGRATSIILIGSDRPVFLSGWSI
jgi:hypothetical protein